MNILYLAHDTYHYAQSKEHSGILSIPVLALCEGHPFTVESAQRRLFSLTEQFDEQPFWNVEHRFWKSHKSVQLESEWLLEKEK
jgi:hypothetical protein